MWYNVDILDNCVVSGGLFICCGGAYETYKNKNSELSLFWRRTNFAGAVAGIVSGGLTVIIWDYIPFINGQTLGTATGLYSLATGFVISILCIVIFSLCTKAPEKEILEEFDRVKKMKEE